MTFFALFLIFIVSDGNLKPENIAVAVISGKELISTRVKSQAQSWFPTFPQVFVYSDEFPESEVKEIRKLSPHANINFVPIVNRSEHIIGSQWKNPWYRAQPRFLPSMYDLWIKNKDKNISWYVLGDDDTYLYIKNILRRLTKHNSSNPEVISFFWCTWNQITDNMLPERDCHPFAQGGSGVLFSKTMMDMLGPNLIRCSEMYNDAEHAASMRVSVCMERNFGYENWSKGAFIKPWKSGIHPSNPSVVIGQGNTWDAPGSFHQVESKEMAKLKNSHIAFIQNLTDFGFVDFAHFAFRAIPVELIRRRWWELYFGYRFENLASHSNPFYALGSLTSNDNGKTFEQEFQGNIKVIIHCDDKINDLQVDVDDVERGPKTKVHLILKCPPIQKYYI